MTGLTEYGDSCGARKAIRLYFVALVSDMRLGRAMAVLAGDTGVLMARRGPLENLRDMAARAYASLAKTGGIGGGLGPRCEGEEEQKDQPHEPDQRLSSQR